MEKRVIVALDVTDRGEAIKIARSIKDEVFAIKVNWPIILGCGLEIIGELGQYAKVICDLKIADIPNTNKLIVEQISKQKPWGVIAHSFLGSDSLEAVVKTNPELKVFSVVAMSHDGAATLMDKHIDKMASMSLDAGVYGVVAPGNKPNTISHIRNLIGDMKIIAPGIGAQGGSGADAIKAGADYIIVGRSIYQSPNPAAALREINMELCAALS